MAEPLWEWDELTAAAGGEVDPAPQVPITGFSIDTRSLEAGDVFVALADARDGHEFVTRAFEAGAVAAIVRTGYERRQGDGALIRVDDPLQALERIGIQARARLSSDARVIAVTGSAGKTSTKEMLRTCYSVVEPGRVHASVKSYNNHWGVPLTLARMPRDTHIGVFEIGMNHPGEITPLTKLVRPDVAIVTTVAPVHLGQFNSVAEIAAAKAEIFAGLSAGGTAIIPADNPHSAFLDAEAERQGARRITFALDPDIRCDVAARSLELSERGSDLVIVTPTGEFPVRVGAPGRHMVANALAVAATVVALGYLSGERVLAGLGASRPAEGRGARSELATDAGLILLIDESYNANPASVRAAIEAVALVPRARFARRVVALGDMLELGPASADYHRALVDAVMAAQVDLVFAAGPMMRELFETLPVGVRGVWTATASELKDHLLDAVRAGDVVMVKGSLGSRMGPLTAALKDRYPIVPGASDA